VAPVDSGTLQKTSDGLSHSDKNGSILRLSPLDGSENNNSKVQFARGWPVLLTWPCRRGTRRGSGGARLKAAGEKGSGCNSRTVAPL